MCSEKINRHFLIINIFFYLFLEYKYGTSSLMYFFFFLYFSTCICIKIYFSVYYCYRIGSTNNQPIFLYPSEDAIPLVLRALKRVCPDNSVSGHRHWQKKIIIKAQYSPNCGLSLKHVRIFKYLILYRSIILWS